jgi:hypothetical protein
LNAEASAAVRLRKRRAVDQGFDPRLDFADRGVTT